MPTRPELTLSLTLSLAVALGLQLYLWLHLWLGLPPCPPHPACPASPAMTVLHLSQLLHGVGPELTGPGLPTMTTMATVAMLRGMAVCSLGYDAWARYPAETRSTLSHAPHGRMGAVGVSPGVSGRRPWPTAPGTAQVSSTSSPLSTNC